MSSISLRRGAKSEIDATPISDGQILFETDQESNRIYMDNGEERIQVGGSETTWDNIQNKPDNIAFWDSALSTTIPNVDYIGVKEISQVAYNNLTPAQKQLEIVYDITDATDNDYYTNAVDVAYNDTETQLGASNVQDVVEQLNEKMQWKLADVVIGQSRVIDLSGKDYKELHIRLRGTTSAYRNLTFHILKEDLNDGIQYFRNSFYLGSSDWIGVTLAISLTQVSIHQFVVSGNDQVSVEEISVYYR